MIKNRLNSLEKIERFSDTIKTVATILISFLSVIVIILLVSKSPMNTIYDFFIGPLKSLRRIGNIFEMAIPITFTGVGICIMYSAGFFNLSGSSAFFFGGLMSAVASINLSLPPIIHPIVSLVIGFMAGALVSFIPAILKRIWDINEVVSSLMLNYIMVFLGNYILRYMIIDPSAGFTASQSLAKSSKLGILIKGTRVHYGIIIAIAVVIFGHIFLNKTKIGYEMKMMGKNRNFAKFAGINGGLLLLVSNLLGGGIAGLGGASEVLGMYTRFEWIAAPTAGFDGVIIGALVRRDPKMVPFAALFLSYIRVGADIISRTSDVPYEIVSIIQAIIILLVGAELFLSGLKHRLIVKSSQAKIEEGEI